MVDTVTRESKVGQWRRRRRRITMVSWLLRSRLSPLAADELENEALPFLLLDTSTLLQIFAFCDISLFVFIYMMPIFGRKHAACRPGSCPEVHEKDPRPWRSACVCGRHLLAAAIYLFIGLSIRAAYRTKMRTIASYSVIFVVLPSLVVEGFSPCSSRTIKRRFQVPYSSSTGNDEPDVNNVDESRRNLLTSLPSSLSAIFGATLVSSPLPAHADLIQFPCQPGDLKNTYNFMRAGESLIEADSMWGSNPLFLTNRENALSEEGMNQVRMTCAAMMERDFLPSVVLYPTAANAIDTADVVATEMRIGRNRVLPEYTNLDARGIGKFDMNDREAVRGAVWAMDAESGPEGRNGERPPPNDDGTPNETLANQVTRLRQLMAVCETNFSGDEVLFIFPDNTGPALLSCLIAGVDLNRVHELEFTPGEIRYDINMDSTLERLRAGPSPEYLETIAQGKVQLSNLRKNPELIVNMKEKRMLEEMQAEEDKMREAKRVAMERKAAQDELKSKAADNNYALKPKSDNKYAVKREEGESSIADLMPLGVMGLAGAMVTYNGGKKEKKEEDIANIEAMNSMMVASNKTDIGAKLLFSNAMEEETNDTRGVPAEDVLEAPELQAMEGLIDKHPIDIPEFTILDGMLEPEKSEEERLVLAEEAMEEYMNQDDGGDAWVNQLQGIMDDDE